ncbi:hypothetical protein P3S68_023645 [Capsicum galapagoense]
MENEEDKAYSQHQKWKKRTKSAGFPSNSMQDLNFTIPLLPAELIPLEIQVCFKILACFNLEPRIYQDPS